MTRRTFVSALLQCLVIPLIFCLAAIVSPAQTFTSLLGFNGTNGDQPQGALVQYKDGTLYGTTFEGGDLTCSPPYGCGSIFKITTAGAITTLHDFELSDGAEPTEGLVLAKDGNFYGTTFSAGGLNGTGYGTIFRLTLTGTPTVTTIHNFCSQSTCNGNASPSGLIQGSDGNLYGTTANLGNTNLNCNTNGCGTIFSISPTTHTYTTLYRFCSLSNCADGFSPAGGVIQGADGNLYGMTAEGGGSTACAFFQTGCGTIFSFNVTTQALTTLHVFALTDGGLPAGALVQANDTNLYGMTDYGGDETCNAPQGCGVIFGISTSGAMIMDHPLSASEPQIPMTGLIQANDGNLYGTTTAGGTNSACTSGACGVIFKSTLSGTVTSLYSFGGGTDGSHPAAPLVQASNGNFYGTTMYNGNDSCNLPIGCGTVFSLSGPPSEALTVTLAGTGSGSVTSSPAGISCPSTCSASFASGTPVTLTAKATTGSTFTGWSGACSGSGTCAVTMSATKSVTATFNSSGGPAVTLTPTSLSFGTIAVGVTGAAKIVTLKNSGTAVLTITSIAITGTNSGDFLKSSTTCGSSLAAAASCTIHVEFKPTASGSRAASVSITDNASGSPQQVSLTGTGTTAKLLPNPLAFGNQPLGTTSAVKKVTLTNVGTSALTITTIAVTGTNAADFPKTATTCGISLAAGASCTVSLEFKPAATGARTADLSVTDGASGSPQLVPLTGTGTTAELTPASLSFGSVTTGTTSAAKAVTFKNVGTTAITSISITIAGTDPGDFAETNTCGTSLAAGASCTISVTFKPTVTGARSATVKVTDSAAASPQAVAIEGTGL